MAFGGLIARPAAFLALGLLSTTAALAQDDGERNQCLRYDQVDAIHQLGEDDIVLEVDGGATLYHISVEPRCFRGDHDNDLTIEGNGEDNCMRTTDRVHFGRRECGIVGVELIETQEQLDALLVQNLD